MRGEVCGLDLRVSRMGQEPTNKSSAFWCCSLVVRHPSTGYEPLDSITRRSSVCAWHSLQPQPTAQVPPHENIIVNLDLASPAPDALAPLISGLRAGYDRRGPSCRQSAEGRAPAQGVEQRAGSRALRAAQLRALRLSPAGARAGCRRLLPVQTFLSSSSSRPPRQLLRARRPAFSAPVAASGSPRAGQRGPRRRPHPALRAAGSRWPRRAGAPRSPRESRPGRRRPRCPSPRRPPGCRRPPCAGCRGTRAPAAARRATCRPARVGAARSASTSPDQVRAARAPGAGGGPARAGGCDGDAASPGRPRALAAGGEEGMGGRGWAKLNPSPSQRSRPQPPPHLLSLPLSGTLGERCSNPASAGARGGRVFLRGEVHRRGAERSLPRARRLCGSREHRRLWFLGLSIRKRNLLSAFRATLVPRKGAVLSLGGWGTANMLRLTCKS